MRGQLDGRVALISGTAQGMGRTAALAFAAEGAIVVGGDLNEAASPTTLAQIAAAGGIGSSARVDVTDEDRTNAYDELEGELDDDDVEPVEEATTPSETSSMPGPSEQPASGRSTLAGPPRLTDGARTPSYASAALAGAPSATAAS
jgi:hypothetical protein